MSNKQVYNKIVTSCENLLERNLITREDYRNCVDIHNKYSLDIDLDQELKKYTGNKGEKSRAHHKLFLSKIKKKI